MDAWTIHEGSRNAATCVSVGKLPKFDSFMLWAVFNQHSDSPGEGNTYTSDSAGAAARATYDNATRVTIRW
jgi:hypothetical protein